MFRSYPNCRLLSLAVVYIVCMCWQNSAQALCNEYFELEISLPQVSNVLSSGKNKSLSPQLNSIDRFETEDGLIVITNRSSGAIAVIDKTGGDILAEDSRQSNIQSGRVELDFRGTSYGKNSVDTYYDQSVKIVSAAELNKEDKSKLQVKDGFYLERPWRSITDLPFSEYEGMVKTLKKDLGDNWQTFDKEYIYTYHNFELKINDLPRVLLGKTVQGIYFNDFSKSMNDFRGVVTRMFRHGKVSPFIYVEIQYGLKSTEFITLPLGLVINEGAFFVSI